MKLNDRKTLATMRKAGWAPTKCGRYLISLMVPGIRFFVGSRVMRLETRVVTPGIRKRNLRGSWKRVESYVMPEDGRELRGLLVRAINANRGRCVGVRPSAPVGHAHAFSERYERSILSGPSLNGSF